MTAAPANSQFILHLPPKTKGGRPDQIKHSGTVLIIGANGSGKSRLGTWIQFHSPHKGRVTRIAAQRILTLPEFVKPESTERDLSAFLFGYEGVDVNDPDSNLHHTFHYKHRGNPNVLPQDDFAPLVTVLFAQFNEMNAIAWEEFDASEDKANFERQRSNLAKVIRIWNSVLPGRALKSRGNKLEVHLTNGESEYNAADLSDGERVIFYLIGQCVLAPANNVIIIDEPELHLNKAIQTRLWNAIQVERPDCQFIFLTHDLQFVASRTPATKLWIKSYQPNNNITGDPQERDKDSAWDWQQIEMNEDLPEDVMLTILGSRESILFVEGKPNSHDVGLYSRLYPNLTVLPRNSCQEVIDATKASAKTKGFHHHDSYAIIDRDHRTDEELAELRSHNIIPLPVLEIENLFLTEPLLKLLAESTNLHDADLLEETKNRVFTRLEQRKTRVAAARTNAQAEKGRQSITAKEEGGLEALKNRYSEELQRLKELDITAIYDNELAEIKQVIGERHYEKALQLLNQKSLLCEVARQVYGFADDKALIAFVFRAIDSKKYQDLEQEIRAYIDPGNAIPTSETQAENLTLVQI